MVGCVRVEEDNSAEKVRKMLDSVFKMADKLGEGMVGKTKKGVSEEKGW